MASLPPLELQRFWYVIKFSSLCFRHSIHSTRYGFSKKNETKLKHYPNTAHAPPPGYRHLDMTFYNLPVYPTNVGRHTTWSYIMFPVLLNLYEVWNKMQVDVISRITDFVKIRNINEEINKLINTPTHKRLTLIHMRMCVYGSFSSHTI